MLQWLVPQELETGKRCCKSVNIVRRCGIARMRSVAYAASTDPTISCLLQGLHKLSGGNSAETGRVEERESRIAVCTG